VAIAAWVLVLDLS